jgi:hypothetical protein
VTTYRGKGGRFARKPGTRPGEDLLFAHITAEQRETWEHGAPGIGSAYGPAGYIDFTSSTGRWFRIIRPKDYPNVSVSRISHKGAHAGVSGYCIHVTDDGLGYRLPAADQALAFILLLRTNESAFLSVANNMRRWPERQRPW